MEYEPDEEETVSFLKDDDDKPLILQPRTRIRIASCGGETTKAIFNDKKLTALLFLALCGIVFVVNGRSETAVFSDLASSSSSYSSSTTHTTTATHNIPIQKDKDGKIVFTCPSGWDADSLEANNIGGKTSRRTTHRSLGKLLPTRRNSSPVSERPSSMPGESPTTGSREEQNPSNPSTSQNTSKPDRTCTSRPAGLASTSS